MTIAQIIENLTEKHVALDPAEPTVDGVICGDISAECTGIVLTCAPTAEVIQKAADIGSNFFMATMKLTGWREQMFMRRSGN